jgi:hypothetical protein
MARGECVVIARGAYENTNAKKCALREGERRGWGVRKSE